MNDIKSIFQYHCHKHKNCSVILVESVTQWLRHWTRDQGAWGSIPAAMVMCKDLRQASTPSLLTHL